MAKPALIILLLLFFLFSAWTEKVHKSSVELLYYSMPDGLKKNISLPHMKEGSIAPDKYFKDFVRHKHPYSYSKALEWINLAEYHHAKGNIENASYSFGVASHYILDSYSMPHYIIGETQSSHKKFEDVDFEFFGINSECSPYSSAYNNLNYREDALDGWYYWINTSDKNIQRKALEHGINAVYFYGLQAFGFDCYSAITIIDDSSIFLSNFVYSLFFALMLAIVIRFF